MKRGALDGLVVNKWDAARRRQGNKRGNLSSRFGINFQSSGVCSDCVCFFGGEDGWERVGLLSLIKKAYEAASRRVTTGELNRFVASLEWEYDMKIYYMTQANVRPPTFVAFTDKAGKLHFSAERYLANRLRERFDFTGTPIEIRTKRR